jgi:flagellar basal-body rod protein FlgC
MRIIAENVANADSAATAPGGAPYRRQIPIFEADFDKELGAVRVAMTGVAPDRSDFRLRYEPGHPSADARGYVSYPNVSSLVEMMDMRTAQRAYEANLSMIETNRALVSRTLELLRA